MADEFLGEFDGSSPDRAMEPAPSPERGDAPSPIDEGSAERDTLPPQAIPPPPEAPTFVIDPAAYGPEFEQVARKLIRLHQRMADADRAEAWGALDGIYESLLGLGRTLGLSTMGYPTLRCCGSGAPPIEKPRPRGTLKRLGDFLACIFHCLGIKQCEECKKRQEYANRFRLPF